MRARMAAVVLAGMAIAPVMAASPTATMATDSGFQRYEGYAYAAGEQKLLFRETHWQYGAAGAREQLILYRCPDGAPFARKRVDLGPSTTIPDFDLLDARNGYRDGVRMHGGAREVFTQADAKAAERTAPLELRDHAAVDAGLHELIRANWDLLNGGGTLDVPLLVPDRLGYFRFNARALRDPPASGDERRWFRLSLAMWLGFALPHIDLGYDSRTRELREYRGLTDIHGPGGHNLNVRIEYPVSERHAGIAMEEVRQAADAPLTGRCLGP